MNRTILATLLSVSMILGSVSPVYAYEVYNENIVLKESEDFVAFDEETIENPAEDIVENPIEEKSENPIEEKLENPIEEESENPIEEKLENPNEENLVEMMEMEAVDSFEAEIGEAAEELVASAEEPFVESGDCSYNSSSNLTYSITGTDEAGYTLTISGNGVMKDYYNSDTRPWNSYRDNIKTLNLEEGITVIGKYAFAGLNELANVDVPETVIRIEDGTFSDCTKLSKIHLPDSLVETEENRVIKGGAFSNTAITNISNDASTSINIPKGLRTIEGSLFRGCTKLTAVTIPGTVEVISQYAFADCTSLESLTIENGVKNIFDNAFSNTGLKSVAIPASVTYIYIGSSGDAFVFKNLESFTVDSNNEYYDSRDNCNALILKYEEGNPDDKDILLRGCNISNPIIPDSVKKIRKFAYKRCDKIKKVTIPGSVTKIEEGAFNSCSELKTAVIESGVEEIGLYVFDGCSSLESIKIPYSVTDITLKDGIPTVGYYNDGGVYKVPDALQKIYVDDGSKAQEIFTADYVTTTGKTEKNLTNLVDIATYDVTFMSKDTVVLQNSFPRQKIEKPSDPVSEGEKLLGWYKDSEFSKKWDFENDIVEKDITLYAKICNHPNDMLVRESTKLPTCDEDGEDQIRCTNCNELQKTEIKVDALGHNYVGGVCSRCDAISLELYKDIEVSVENIRYDGNTHTPTVSVSVAGKELIKDADFTVTVDGKSEIGFYDLKITGIGKYRDEINKRWLVYSSDGLLCEPIPDQVYTGKQIKPEVNVYSNGNLLTKGKDYTISYGSYNTNVAAKDAKNSKNDKSIAPSVTITGKGNYTGSQVVNFAIVPKSVDAANVDDIIVVKSNNPNKVTPVVMLDGKKLKAGTDYIVSKTTNPADEVTEIKETGKYNLYVLGKGNYCGTKAFNFTITGDVLSSKVSIDKIADQKYTGGFITPDIKITYQKKSNVVTDKFDILYENNIEIGTATVIITAKEGSGFAGSKKATFKITGLDISKSKLGSNGKGTITAKTYDGNKHTPTLDLYYGNTALVDNKDYTVTYTNNVNVGTATALVTGKGMYTGTKKYTFKISKYDAGIDSNNVIKVNNGIVISESYVKGGATPKPVVSMNGIILTEKKDYTLRYTNNKAVAASDAVNPKNGKSIAPTVTINFKGNYSGKKAVKFTITPKNISECTLTLADMKVSTKANGWKQTKATIADSNGKTLSAGTDYEKNFKYYTDSTYTNEITSQTLEAGNTVYVRITGIKNYAGSEIRGSYYISKDNISSVRATIADQTFTGSELKPTTISVTIGSGKNQKELTAGTDYEIVAGSYKNNINKGTASVTIRGKGDYFGTKVVKFRIVYKSL